MKKLLLISLMLFSCSDKTEKQINEELPNYYDNRSNDFEYLFDKKTNLCYMIDRWNRLNILTNVPCTPEVMNLVINK